MRRARTIGIVANALLLTACNSATEPSPVPTNPSDPPRITCPAPQTVQMLTLATSQSVIYGNATVVGGRQPVTTTCLPASGSLFTIGRTTVSCTTTDSQQRTDACTFVVTVLPVPQLSVTSFVAFGDSITAGESGLDTLPTFEAVPLRFRPTVLLPFEQRYPSVLQQRLAARYVVQTPTVRNEGQSGEAVTDPGTVPRFIRITSSGQYAAVLIMEGTNDLTVKDSLIITPAINGLRQMVRDAKSRSMRPFLATIPPINPGGFRGATYAWFLVPDFNASVRTLAASESVPLVDVNQAFGGDFSLLGLDGLHPNSVGYQRIADTFFAAIRQTLEIQSAASTATGAPGMDALRLAAVR